MNKSLPLLFFLVSFSLKSISQTNNQTEKECRISSGMGLGSAAKNSSSAGRDIWLQLDYRLSRSVSIATEVENLTFKQPGYIENLPVSKNEITDVATNFSLLLKYHFPLKSALKLAIASGWSYSITQNEYYTYRVDSTSQEITPNETSNNQYTIPFLLEIEYPVLKKLDIGARAKYNLYSQGGSTYAISVGMSLKL